MKVGSVRGVESMRTGKFVMAFLVGAFQLVLWPARAQVDPGVLQHWKYDQNLPLDARQIAMQERNGVKIEDVTYASPVGDRGKAVGPNGGKVTAYLVLPAGNGPFPAVIYGHWCM